MGLALYKRSHPSHTHPKQIFSALGPTANSKRSLQSGFDGRDKSASTFERLQRLLRLRYCQGMLGTTTGKPTHSFSNGVQFFSDQVYCLLYDLPNTLFI
jgi:hypothetical protein